MSSHVGDSRRTETTSVLRAGTAKNYLNTQAGYVKGAALSLVQREDIGTVLDQELAAPAAYRYDTKERTTTTEGARQRKYIEKKFQEKSRRGCGGRERRGVNGHGGGSDRKDPSWLSCPLLFKFYARCHHECRWVRTTPGHELDALASSRLP